MCVNASADAGLVAVLGPLHFVYLCRTARALVGEVLGLWGLACYQRLLTGIGRVAIDPLLIAVQQIRQWVLVMHVGGRDNRAMAQSRLAVHTNVQLHAEVPLLPFAGLVHLGVSGFVGILRRAGCADDGGVHDGAGIDLDAARLQLLAHTGEQGFTQLVVVEQPAKPEHGGGVGHGLATQVDADETTQAGTVVQGLLAG